MKIAKLLKILDEEMVNLKLLAVQHKWETFYLKIFDFSRKLYRVRQLIRRFIAIFGVSPIVGVDLIESTISLGFRSLSVKAGVIESLGPITLKLNRVLLDMLLREIPKPHEIDRVVSDRIRKAKIWEEEELLRPGEAARILGVSYKTLWRWYREGIISAKQLPSGHLRYYRSEIEKISKAKANVVHKNNL